MQAHIRTQAQTRWLYLLMIVLGGLAALDDYRGWRFLLLALLGLWAISRYWAHSLAQGLRLRREMRFGWAQVGDRMEERFTLFNDGYLPALWVELCDHSNLPDYQAGLVTGVDGGGMVQWRTDGQCSRRGLFTLGPTSLRTADPFGFYTIELHDSHSVTLMVTPPIVPLPEIEVSQGGRAGEGRPRPNAPERTVSAFGVRQYQTGDSLRWIHWPTSARRDEWFVRLFESRPSGDWWIVLDVDQAVQAGEGFRSTAEHGVILAASLADRGLHLRRAVGMAAYGEPLVWLPPKEGDVQRWETLRSLALLNPAGRSLAELLEGIRPSVGRNASMVIITPDTQGAWLASLLPYLWQGIIPTVLLLDRPAFGGSGDAGPLLERLAQWGIHRYLIPPDLLDRPEAHPGQRGHFDWRVSPFGRAILRNPPRENWKVVS